MKSTAPLIAAGAGAIAVIIGVLFFGEQIGIGGKPVEPKDPEAQTTVNKNSQPASVSSKSEAKTEKPVETAEKPAEPVAEKKADESTSASDASSATAETKPEKEAEPSGQVAETKDASDAIKTEEASGETVDNSEAAASKEETSSEATTEQNAKNEQPAAVANNTDAGSDAADSKTDEAVEVVTPSFDIVRVEPDGNTLVAGRASPNWVVELRNGADILSTAKADENGEWVMILEESLSEGVSDLSLAAKENEESDPVLSTGSVTVALPENGKGELLVVENVPGKPSKILAKIVDQEKLRAEKQAAEIAKEAAEKEEASKVAAALAAEAAAKAAKEAEEKAAQEKAAMEAEAAKKAEEAKAAEMAAAKAEEEAKAKQEAEAKAKAEAEAKAKAEEAAAMAAAVVAIEAVEIEGDTLFVAGAAEPAGSILRMYVDNKAISDTRSGETGRFLFDGALKLEPGNHALRVDLLDTKSGKVLKRAEVTFDKAAPAAPAGSPSGSQTASDQQTESAGTADEEKSAAASDGSKPSTEEAAQAAKSSGDSLQTEAKPTNISVMKGNKVIIRRGDNLWEIARRVYGAGIRYSTIYDSNTDQIRDPHWIYPGQVFELPEGQDGWESNFDAVDHPNGEEAPE